MFLLVIEGIPLYPLGRNRKKKKRIVMLVQLLFYQQREVTSPRLYNDPEGFVLPVLFLPVLCLPQFSYQDKQLFGTQFFPFTIHFVV